MHLPWQEARNRSSVRFYYVPFSVRRKEKQKHVSLKAKFLKPQTKAAAVQKVKGASKAGMLENCTDVNACFGQ